MRGIRSRSHQGVRALWRNRALPAPPQRFAGSKTKRVSVVVDATSAQIVKGSKPEAAAGDGSARIVLQRSSAAVGSLYARERRLLGPSIARRRAKGGKGWCDMFELDEDQAGG